VAEQARPALAAEESGKQAKALSKTQDGLKERVVKVTDRIKELPDAELNSLARSTSSDRWPS